MATEGVIVAPATGPGGAIAIVRVSGPGALSLCDAAFRSASGKKLSDQPGNTVHYGRIVDGDCTLDDVLVTVFRAPRSYTGEEMAEVSCHASGYVVREITALFIRLGARAAEPGEFTVRAFLAGKMDLSQAEAVADVIASRDRASHALASNQMRGGYSAEFAHLRAQLVELVSLLELELDFGEEDVEFADRARLRELMLVIRARLDELAASFARGNALKTGVGVAIAGKPNVGKSTLLNALLRDDRAMVSDIAGTTRDTIEECLDLGGVTLRFIDTAGLRHTDEALERMGIERTLASVRRASLVLLVADAAEFEALSAECPMKTLALARRLVTELIDTAGLRDDQQICFVINKVDQATPQTLDNIRRAAAAGIAPEGRGEVPVLTVSARHGADLTSLTDYLHSFAEASAAFAADQTVVTNARHYEALTSSSASLSRALSGLDTLPADLLSQDLRSALHDLGLITGEITTDDILSSIFSKFCIGK